MISKSAMLFSIILAICGVLGSSSETIPAAIVFGVLYVVSSLLPTKHEDTRFVLSAVFGFPLVLAAGNAVTAGLVTALLLISLLAAGNALSRKTVLCAVIAGVAAFICAIQSSAVLAIVIAAVLSLLVLYILFIAEYRLRKQLTENPHETQ